MEFYATLGAACADRETILALFRAGMTGARLNLSHTSLDACAGLLTEEFYPAARAADFICRRLLIENFLRSCVLMIKQRWNHLTGKQHTGTPRGRRKAAESFNDALSVLSGRKGKIFKINKVLSRPNRRHEGGSYGKAVMSVYDVR